MESNAHALTWAQLTEHEFADFYALYNGLESCLNSQTLKTWYDKLPVQLDAGLNPTRWGDLSEWLTHWRSLPNPINSTVDFKQNAVTLTTDDTVVQSALHTALMGLHPWRKGPFHFFGIDVDTEWRSCLKWGRIAPHLNLTDKTILDVGCGNGYYGWRMLGDKARAIIGIDPSPRFVLQWGSVKRYCPTEPNYVIPIGIEALPPQLQAFDVTFSMGVLYHRKSCFDHLQQLKDTLVPGGQLVLETLVIPGPTGMTLLPESRYAKMRNVWQLPSVGTLLSWVNRCGFQEAEVVDESTTTPAEQRRTDWMQFESLTDFLDPHDASKTIEGYPAPRRVVVLAKKP